MSYTNVEVDYLFKIMYKIKKFSNLKVCRLYFNGQSICRSYENLEKFIN